MGLTRRQFMRLAAAVAALPLAACARPATGPEGPDEVSATGFYFNTVCGLGGSMDEDVLEGALDLCAGFEQLFSRTIPTSDVARINAAAGAPVEVDAQTAELIGLALGYCEESGGLFDITIGAVSELWDFVEGVVADPDAIAAALPHVDWRGVEVEGHTVRLADPEARLDLGGIAKGYIADRIVDYFAGEGVASAYVNLGGNVCVLGPKADGSAWNVGVRDPEDPSGASVVATIRTDGGSVVTSGLYERSFEKDGRRYWHILDPRTGYPAQTEVQSASIFSAASIDGDGYTKPLFMLEVADALAFVEAKPGLQGLLVLSDGTTRTTPSSDFVY